MNSFPHRSKVFLLASTLTTGGAEQVIRALAIGLPAYDFNTHIVCLHELGDLGMEISKLGITADFGFSRGRLDPFVFFRLVRLFRGENDAILCSLDHHDATFWGAVSSSFAGIRHRILSIHSTGLWGKGGSFSRSDRLVLSHYDRIVALAQIHADYLEKDEGIGRDKIAVINNGIDTDRFKPPASDVERAALRERLNIPANSFVVAIVAVLRPEKNHEMLLRAAREVLANNENFILLIVGDGQEAGNLHRMAQELSLGEAVRFMGQRSDIPDILSVSDVSVLCSHPIVETFPLAVLESMATGIPVVATAVGSIPEMLESGKEGVLIPSGDTEALTEAIVSLARDPERRKRIGQAGRKKVEERYCESRMVEGYANLCRSLLEGR